MSDEPEMPMPIYIGTKVLRAIPMTQGAYNSLRAAAAPWVPSDKNPDEDGYLVEYMDGGVANHPDYEGYISWSPADVFEKAYVRLEPVHGDVAGPEPIAQFFTYTHLPVHLQKISKPFAWLASLLLAVLPRNPERTTALRKLLEAKDCAVRAVLYR